MLLGIGPTLLIDQDLMDSIPNDSPQAVVAVKPGICRLLVAVNLSSCAIAGEIDLTAGLSFL